MGRYASRSIIFVSITAFLLALTYVLVSSPSSNYFSYFSGLEVNGTIFGREARELEAIFSYGGNQSGPDHSSGKDNISLRENGILETSETNCSRIPLKVYVYDLPQKFNFGLLRKNSQGPKGNLLWKGNPPKLPVRLGLRNQHSVSYFLLADLWNKHQIQPNGSSTIRVLDPSQADAFFIPFFASLSFNSFGKSMRDPETKKDEALQAEIVEMMHHSEWWQRYGGRDHVLCMTHPNAMRFKLNFFNNSILILADFGRKEPQTARLAKDVIAPYNHMVPILEHDPEMADQDHELDAFGRRKILLFFQGTIDRKDGGWIRKAILKITAGEPDVVIVDGRFSQETFGAAIEGMRMSKFCLHLAGDTPSSCRLFDAIMSNCVPVIISDHLELPFEDDIDYRQFSLFVSSKNGVKKGYLVKLLKAVSKSKWLDMWRNLKKVKQHFEYKVPAKIDDATDMIWRQVQRKLSSARLFAHRSRRLVIPDWIPMRKH